MTQAIKKTKISFILNNKQVVAEKGETILTVAKRYGISIPQLCYSDKEGADGNCRSCMVEVENSRVLLPSCCTYPTQDIKVTSNNDRAKKSQKMVLELLKSEISEESYTLNSELDYWLKELKVNESRFDTNKVKRTDTSHPAISVNFDACIKCSRCIRACRDSQNNDVLGMSLRGHKNSIIFDLNDEMGQSTCVACGECVQACPTGALVPANQVKTIEHTKIVPSVCPYCGVGCQLNYKVKNNKIIEVEGAMGPANKGRLCVKGRYGFDYVHHPHRLTKPLIRRKDQPKLTNKDLDPNNFYEVFREATWEEAIQFAAKGFKEIKEKNSKNDSALAGFGSAKCSNEEAYLFQKFIRTGFETNNVDHCTRLCHASSVTALLECLGSGAVSNPVSDVDKAEIIIIIGANPTINHPVAATWIKNAVRRGTKLILMNPSIIDLSREATHNLTFKPGSDVPMLNAIMHTIIEENLIDTDFIAKRTEGFNEIKQHLKKYSPESMSAICGIPADTLKQVARMYASSKTAMILWGMGVSQHVNGTDNARCLIALSLMTGQIGRPGTGLHPLRGQNNVQGASDMGLIPMTFPDYQPVDNEEKRKNFEKLWNTKLDKNPGLTVVEIINKAYTKEIKGLYIMGENPAMSDPDANHARQALAKLEHMVVQDIFLTETAYLADVILPASAHAEKVGTFTNTDRYVQLSSQAIIPPGEAKQDLWIIEQIAQQFKLGWNYNSKASKVFEEMRQAVPTMAGMTWDRLNKEKSIVYPCVNEGDLGDEVIFINSFKRENGLGKFIAANISSPDELPDDEYPLILITGRVLEHWHTGSMTRRSNVLDCLKPYAVVDVNPTDLEKNNIRSGDLISISTRRGEISALAHADTSLQVGTVFMAFCYYEAAVNKLSNAALDPLAKIPEFKYCAVKISAGGKSIKFSSYGGGQAKNSLVE